MSAKDEPLWGWSHVIKRVTGHEGQGEASCRREHTNGLGIDDLRRFHYVGIGSTGGGDGDALIGLRSLQGAKESVAMRCDADVARFARQCGAFNVSRSEAEISRLRPFEDHGGNVQGGHIDATDYGMS